ncbi:DUF3861 domain-containing protein [Stutzerimonas nitrititolerans]|uniref:DUF3861 domain-containing protein n=1 Tax=Stutzerimonas nitrititolerans TaxID=2482751 RepID=UPI0028A21886|nr:DUF3861 domain-containing protein [Stutzerimonas nitrititolerans]
MKQHRYRVTVEHLSDAQGAPSKYKQPLSFEVGNHDDIFDIVQRTHERVNLDATSATAFAVGLKLFSEVMLENGKHQIFQEFAPHFRTFMKNLKKMPEGS